MEHGTTHEAAVNQAIAAARLEATDTALVALLRTLARQMDAAGSDGPGTRLAASYLTALRTLAQRTRETATNPRPAQTTTVGTLARRARAMQRPGMGGPVARRPVVSPTGSSIE